MAVTCAKHYCAKHYFMRHGQKRHASPLIRLTMSIQSGRPMGAISYGLPIGKVRKPLKTMKGTSVNFVS